MNAAIRAATLVARAQGVDVVGIERGDRGLLDGAFVPLAAAGRRRSIGCSAAGWPTSRSVRCSAG